MTRNTSLTTADTFIAMIADLPLMVIEKTQYGGIALMPTEGALLAGANEDLFHALTIRARKRGLRVRRGCVVWNVNGCYVA